MKNLLNPMIQYIVEKPLAAMPLFSFSSLSGIVPIFTVLFQFIDACRHSFLHSSL